MGGYLLANFISGAIAGAIGAGVSENSSSPILKGAIVTGLISTGMSAVLIALAPKQVTSGTVSGLQKEWGL